MPRRRLDSTAALVDRGSLYDDLWNEEVQDASNQLNSCWVGAAQPEASGLRMLTESPPGAAPALIGQGQGQGQAALLGVMTERCSRSGTMEMQHSAAPSTEAAVAPARVSAAGVCGGGILLDQPVGGMRAAQMQGQAEVSAAQCSAVVGHNADQYTMQRCCSTNALLLRY